MLGHKNVAATILRYLKRKLKRILEKVSQIFKDMEGSFVS
ncbi:hypothetical protein HMPREF0766_10169 [Sphingobacterium spiritivorum ATCC 33861]|uniref:Uncharacterized protein n=1 Tax=Sphingobacterium spiritivorum ATCC 33861 TaxID=525373 RepID=D7VGQ0_SPHSI|nr:hypothetical protein HMPREF0766_10169 [Sphingobacterium spiritivorum ATCC 33861]